MKEKDAALAQAAQNGHVEIVKVLKGWIAREAPNAGPGKQARSPAEESETEQP
jgi:hypothetical protein